MGEPRHSMKKKPNFNNYINDMRNIADANPGVRCEFEGFSAVAVVDSTEKLFDKSVYNTEPVIRAPLPFVEGSESYSLAVTRRI